MRFTDWQARFSVQQFPFRPTSPKGMGEITWATTFIIFQLPMVRLMELETHLLHLRIACPTFRATKSKVCARTNAVK